MNPSDRAAELEEAIRAILAASADLNRVLLTKNECERAAILHEVNQAFDDGEASLREVNRTLDSLL